MSDLTRPETKEEDQRGKERLHWREEESQKRAAGEVEMVRNNRDRNKMLFPSGVFCKVCLRLPLCLRWEEEKYTDGSKWRFLEHKGPVFPPPYEPLPDRIRFYYDGEER